MEYVRYSKDGIPTWGQIDGDRIQELDGPPWAGGTTIGSTCDRAGARLLAPVTPTKIVCVGRNYLEHARELGNEVPEQPLLFLKPPSSIIGPDEAIIYPPITSNLHFEGELVAVIGRRARHLTQESALDVVFGYTCANDITARDLQKLDGQWTRAKGCDTFCPVGPVVVPGLDPQALTLRTRVNGELRQEGTTDMQIFPLAQLLAYITASITLEPGDMVLTGTPAGVGPLQVGDIVEVEIPGLGTLRNTVAAPDAS